MQNPYASVIARFDALLALAADCNEQCNAISEGVMAHLATGTLIVAPATQLIPADKLLAFASSVLGGMCAGLEQSLANLPLPITIDRKELMATFPLNVETVHHYKLGKVWSWLVVKYAGDPEEKAKELLAGRLLNHLEGSGTQRTERAGKVIVNLRVHHDRAFRSTTCYLESQSERQVIDCLRALAQTGRLHGYHSMEDEVESYLARHQRQGRWVIEPRDKQLFGNQLELVTYKDRFEIKLTRTFADQLQLFIANHHKQALASA